jgi:hypothetical protein
MITLETKSSPFSFNISQDKLSSVLGLMSSQAGSDAAFILSAVDSKLWLSAVGTSFVGLMLLEGTSSGTGNFAFDLKMLQGVVKGRSDFDFNYTGSELEFKALKTKYSGKVVTLPVTKEQASIFNEISQEKIKGVKLTDEVLSEISTAVKCTSIKNVATKESINSLISIKKGKLYVSANDDYHIILYTCKLESEEIKFSINPFVLLGIEKAIGGKFELSVKPENLRFQTKTSLFVIPTNQAEEEKYNLPIDYVSNLGKEKFSASVSLANFLSVCENLDAIHTVNSQFDFSLKDGLQIQFKTEQGSASDKIDVGDNSGKGKCSVDPKTFIEVLSLHKSHSSEGQLLGYETVSCLITKKKKAKLHSVVVLTDSKKD